MDGSKSVTPVGEKESPIHYVLDCIAKGLEQHLFRKKIEAAKEELRLHEFMYEVQTKRQGSPPARTVNKLLEYIEWQRWPELKASRTNGKLLKASKEYEELKHGVKPKPHPEPGDSEEKVVEENKRDVPARWTTFKKESPRTAVVPAKVDKTSKEENTPNIIKRNKLFMVQTPKKLADSLNRKVQNSQRLVLEKPNALNEHRQRLSMEKLNAIDEHRQRLSLEKPNALDENRQRVSLEKPNVLDEKRQRLSLEKPNAVNIQRPKTDRSGKSGFVLTTYDDDSIDNVLIESSRTARMANIDEDKLFTKRSDKTTKGGGGTKCSECQQPLPNKYRGSNSLFRNTMEKFTQTQKKTLKKSIKAKTDKQTQTRKDWQTAGENKSDKQNEEAARIKRMLLLDSQTRMSRVSLEGIRETKPNLATLAERPAGLAERFYKLHEKDWAEALEELKLSSRYKDEDEIIDILLQVVKRAKEFCSTTADSQFRLLSKSVKETMAYHSVFEKRPGSVPSSYKPRRRTSEEAFQKIKQSMKNIRKEHASVSIPMIKSLFHDEVLRDMFEKGQVPRGACFKRYADNCSEILWLMSVQDSPMHLQYCSPGEKSPQNFQIYSRTGDTVVRCVWPALYLKEGGPILNQGVAVFKREREPIA